MNRRRSERARNRVLALRQKFYRGIPNPLHTFKLMLQDSVKSDTRVLDLGCGRNCPVLRELRGVRYGVDLVEDLEAPKGVRAIRASADVLPFPDSSFDVIYSTSVLEHLKDPRRAFEEIARTLTPGGSCFILTPNKWDYVSLVARLIPNRCHPVLVRWMTGRPEADTFPTYYLANTRRAIDALATAAGLDATVELLRQHPHYLSKHPALYVIGIALEMTLQRPFPLMRPWIQASLRKRTAN